MYNKFLITPKIGKIYYENNTNVVCVVETMNGTTARTGTSSTNPFIIKIDGVNSLSELTYKTETNSYKTINIVFSSTPTNSSSLLSEFYVQFQTIEGTNIGSAIKLTYSTTQTTFPVNTVLSVIIKYSANVYSGTIPNTFNGVNIAYTALDDDTYNMVIS